ncbi:MAG: hypothetical protein U0807_10900 [Candidatus Binatia bacterium]
MHRALSHLVPLLAVVGLAAACHGPVVPNPLVGQTRYLCCNLHYEKPEVSDVNYQVGVMVPFGTRVQILEVRRSSVKFQAEGHPPITAVLKYGDHVITMDQFMSRLFVADDPHGKLPRGAGKPAGKPTGKKGAPPAPAASTHVRELIESGTVEEGMTRDQVLLALGYPPAHRTPNLDAAAWTYWHNHWATFVVYFDGNRVSRVER